MVFGPAAGQVDSKLSTQSRCFSQRTPSPAAHQSGLLSASIQALVGIPPQNAPLKRHRSHHLPHAHPFTPTSNPMGTWTKLTILVRFVCPLCCWLYGSTARCLRARSNHSVDLSICRFASTTQNTIRVTTVARTRKMQHKLCKNKMCPINRARQLRILPDSEDEVYGIIGFFLV